MEEIFKIRKMVIKYRIMSEDLDALVSIKCNDDLVHMWEEHDRLISLSTTSTPRFLRLFLFSSTISLAPSMVYNYLEAINGQHVDPSLNHHTEPSRDHYVHSSSIRHIDDLNEHHVEVPRAASHALPSLGRNQFQRVWSTPNLHEAQQTGGEGVGPTCQTQYEHPYQYPPQLVGHTHQHACGRSGTCQCGNVCGYPLPTPADPTPIRVPSYQNLNLVCQTGPVLSDRTGSKQVLSPRAIGKRMPNSIPNASGLQNPASSNILQSTIANDTGVLNHYTCNYTHNPIPNNNGMQNMMPSCSGAFGSVGSMYTNHVPAEMGSSVYLQRRKSGTGTPGGRLSRAGTPPRHDALE